MDRTDPSSQFQAVFPVYCTTGDRPGCTPGKFRGCVRARWDGFHLFLGRIADDGVPRANPSGHRPGPRSGFDLYVGDSVWGQIADHPWHDGAFVRFLSRYDSRRRMSGGACPAAVVSGEALNPGELIACAETIVSELSARKRGWQTAVIAGIVGIAVAAYRGAEELPDNSGYSRIVAETVSCVYRRYAETLTLSGLAEQCHVSPSHLSHRFHEETGVTLFAYINQVRVDRACLLLRRSDQSILEIAYAVGFTSLSFFNRTFRGRTGLSPTQYRRTGRRRNSAET